MLRVGVEVGFGVVAAVEHVSEGEKGRSGSEDWTGGEVEDRIEGDEAAEVGDHGVDFGRINVGFDLKEDHVLDSSGGGGGHGRFDGEAGFEKREAFGRRESKGKWSGQEGACSHTQHC